MMACIVLKELLENVGNEIAVVVKRRTCERLRIRCDKKMTTYEALIQDNKYATQVDELDNLIEEPDMTRA